MSRALVKCAEETAPTGECGDQLPGTAFQAMECPINSRSSLWKAGVERAGNATCQRPGDRLSWPWALPSGRSCWEPDWNPLLGRPQKVAWGWRVKNKQGNSSGSQRGPTQETLGEPRPVPEVAPARTSLAPSSLGAPSAPSNCPPPPYPTARARHLGVTEGCQVTCPALWQATSLWPQFPPLQNQRLD